MNRATDDDVRAWSDRHGIDGRSVSELRAAFEDAQSLAAADTLLSRRMPTREAIRDALRRGWNEYEASFQTRRSAYDFQTDAIADLFGVTD